MKAYARKLTLSVIRTISKEALQDFCKRHGYCNDCEWYEEEILLASVNKAVTDDDVVRIANTIYCYTDVESIKAECDMTSKDVLNLITWGLLNEVCTYSPIVGISK